jgi:hypothetical protein
VQSDRKRPDSSFRLRYIIGILTGCSTQSVKTIETEQRVQYATGDDQARPDPVVKENRTTKTEETKTEGQPVGLLSGTVHVVGQAIALPFRVVTGSSAWRFRRTRRHDTVQPGGGPEQSPSGMINEQNREGERKSERR